MHKPKLIRVTTIPLSLDKLLDGQLKYMTQDFDVTAISTNDNGYLENIANREKVAFKSIHLTRSITPYADLKALIQLTRYFIKEKPDIVHTHTPKAGTIGMLAAKIAGIPVKIHTVAGLPLLEAKGAKRLLLNIVEKITYWAADKLLPNSYGLRDIIIDLGFTSKRKLEVIGKGSSNGINTTYFDPKLYTEAEKNDIRKKWNIHRNDFVFLFVGRLVKDKGIEELVQAFKSFQDKSIKLLLVGLFENELKVMNHKTLNEIKVNPNIIATGWQYDVRPFFAISNVLTFASYREGFPNVVMQAGAMGLPSIVSNINGCNEIIRHEKNGLIIPVKNANALQKAMDRLLNDEKLYSELQLNARPCIVKNYQPNEIWKELREMYNHELRKIRE